MIFAKKVSNTDITLCVPRYDWAANTYFEMYSDDNINLANSKFYTLTDDYNV
jgi:hypothetical protein